MTIYQIFTRLYGNMGVDQFPNGTIEQNGCAKMNGFTEKVLRRIKADGYTHVWYTGLLEHATQTDYTAYGIAKDHPVVVKGKAGSPYAVKDYYDIDPDLAVKVPQRMKEFEALVERTHKCGLKMIMDFVPNHVARQYHSDACPKGVKDLGEDDDTSMHFSTSNNFYYCWGHPLNTDFAARRDVGEYPYIEQPAKATGNDHFDAWPGLNDWYETVKLNYGVDYCDAGGRSCHFAPLPDTWKKMCDILLFWAGKGIDAFRCDMAEMVPVEFWEWAIAEVKKKHPSIEFIAEVYNPAEYRNYIHRGGFDYLYDKVGLYDTLRAIICRQAPAHAITEKWQTVDDIRHHMLYFLENHDEQRIASPQFCGDAFKALPALVCEAFLFNNPLMIYAGQEVGEPAIDAEGFSGRDGRTTIFDYWSLASLRKLYQLSASTRKTIGYVRPTVKPGSILTAEETMLYDYYHRVLTLRETEPAFVQGTSFDLMYANWGHQQGFNPGCHYAFLRSTEEQHVLVVCNFSDEQADMGVMIPEHAFDFLHLPEGSIKATDLLTGKTSNLSLYRNSFAAVSVPANGAVVLSF